MNDGPARTDRNGATSGGADPRLEDLLELWEGLEEDSGQPNSLGITVMVSGVTYSGLLIPGRVWARSLATLLRSAGDSPQVRAVAGLFDEITGSLQVKAEHDETASYLHLANVAVGLPSDDKRTSLLMRIRAADVSAWTVGTIGELAPLQPPAG